MEKIKEVLYDENLHFEHEIWMSELDFWDIELKSFTNRLSELVTRWTKNEVLKQLEHYQNQFILHGGVINNLREIIEEHEASIAGHNLKGNKSLDVALVKRHFEFREKMEKQRQIYTELKKNFFQFLSK